METTDSTSATQKKDAPTDFEGQASPLGAELEQVIAEIWRRALQLESVDWDDNFFDLGGHSLAMLKVYDQLRATLGVEVGGKKIELVELYEHPTVRAIANRLRSAGAGSMELNRMKGRAQKQRDASKHRHQIRSGRNVGK